jgi:hypothetical protein
MTFDSLLKRILPSVKGCPDSLAILHLREALIQFCEGTLAWQVWLDDIDTVADQSAYPMVLPPDSALVKLIEFKLDGEDADVVTPAKGRSMRLHDSGAQVAWTADRINVEVSPTPTVDGSTLSLLAALKPTQDAETVDDTLAEHYVDHLVDGALARLLEIEGVAWENPQRAAIRLGRFQDAIDTIGARVAKGFSSAQRRSKAFLY